jgi:hypothetical protein
MAKTFFAVLLNKKKYGLSVDVSLRSTPQWHVRKALRLRLSADVERSETSADKPYSFFHSTSKKVLANFMGILLFLPFHKMH